MCIFFQFLPHISISMSLKSFSIYIFKFLELYISAVLLPIPNKHMMTINFDTITNNYEVIYVIKTVMKYHLKKIDTNFHQPLPNMVQLEWGL
jgi:hypothetical protein